MAQMKQSSAREDATPPDVSAVYDERTQLYVGRNKEDTFASLRQEEWTPRVRKLCDGRLNSSKTP